MEQDPAFAFRILADIAIKALSPAINDPTTAVITIDQLHRLLGQPASGTSAMSNSATQRAKLRVIFPHAEPGRLCESRLQRNPPFRRRQFPGHAAHARVMENLTQTLPTHRHADLHRQLALLDRAIDRHYPFDEDRALARIGDSQGLGGAAGTHPLR